MLTNGPVACTGRLPGNNGSRRGQLTHVHSTPTSSSRFSSTSPRPTWSPAERRQCQWMPHCPLRRPCLQCMLWPTAPPLCWWYVWFNLLVGALDQCPTRAGAAAAASRGQRGSANQRSRRTMLRRSSTRVGAPVSDTPARAAAIAAACWICCATSGGATMPSSGGSAKLGASGGGAPPAAATGSGAALGSLAKLGGGGVALTMTPLLHGGDQRQPSKEALTTTISHQRTGRGTGSAPQAGLPVAR